MSSLCHPVTSFQQGGLARTNASLENYEQFIRFYYRIMPFPIETALP